MGILPFPEKKTKKMKMKKTLKQKIILPFPEKKTKKMKLKKTVNQKIILPFPEKKTKKMKMKKTVKQKIILPFPEKKKKMMKMKKTVKQKIMNLYREMLMVLVEITLFEELDTSVDKSKSNLYEQKQNNCRNETLFIKKRKNKKSEIRIILNCF